MDGVVDTSELFNLVKTHPFKGADNDTVPLKENVFYQIYNVNVHKCSLQTGCL